MTWKPFAKFKIPVFGQMDLALVPIKDVGVRCNLIAHVVVNPSGASLGPNPVSNMPFSLPSLSAGILPSTFLGTTSDPSGDFNTGWPWIGTKATPAFMFVGSCGWTWMEDHIHNTEPSSVLPDGKGDHNAWLEEGIDVDDKYFAASAFPGGPLKTLGYSRQAPLAIGNSAIWWPGKPPPEVAVNYAGYWGAGFATPDRYIPMGRPPCLVTVTKLRKKFGPLQDTYKNADGSVRYWIKDVTSEYEKASALKQFPYPVTYLNDQLPPNGTQWELLPSNAQDPLVIRFGFEPSPPVQFMAGNEKAQFPVTFIPARVEWVTIDIEQLA